MIEINWFWVSVWLYAFGTFNIIAGGIGDGKLMTFGRVLRIMTWPVTFPLICAGVLLAFTP